VVVTTGQLGNARERFAEQGYVLLRGALPAKLCSNHGAAAFAECRQLTNAGRSITPSNGLTGHPSLAFWPAEWDLLKGLKEAGVQCFIAHILPAPLTLAVGNLTPLDSAATLVVLR
jgi:hypothetical protein